MKISILQIFDFNPGLDKRDLGELLQTARVAVRVSETERAVFTGCISDAQSFTFSHMEKCQQPDAPHASGPWYGRTTFGQKGPGAKVLKEVRIFWTVVQRNHQTMRDWLELADRVANGQLLVSEEWQEARIRHLVTLAADTARRLYGGLLAGLGTREVDDVRQHGDNIRALLRTVETLQQVCAASERMKKEGV